MSHLEREGGLHVPRESLRRKIDDVVSDLCYALWSFSEQSGGQTNSCHAHLFILRKAHHGEATASRLNSRRYRSSQESGPRILPTASAGPAQIRGSRRNPKSTVVLGLPCRHLCHSR